MRSHFNAQKRTTKTPQQKHHNKSPQEQNQKAYTANDLKYGIRLALWPAGIVREAKGVGLVSGLVGTLIVPRYLP